MVKYWNSRHTVCWRAALQFRLVKNPQLSTYHFVDITPTSEYIEQIRIIIAIIHYSSYGKRDMWLDWLEKITTRNQTLKSPNCLAMLRPILIRHCPWQKNTTGATVLKMVWKSAVFLMIIKSDQSISVQPIECWNLCGERWRKHLGHSAKTEKEQYQRMEIDFVDPECLWTRCGSEMLWWQSWPLQQSLVIRFFQVVAISCLVGNVDDLEALSRRFFGEFKWYMDVP